MPTEFYVFCPVTNDKRLKLSTQKQRCDVTVYHTAASIIISPIARRCFAVLLCRAGRRRDWRCGRLLKAARPC